MEQLKYTKDHEWAKIEGNIAWIGITDHAQSALGDVVFVDLPKKGSTYHQGDTFGTVESVKAASDLYMPISGEVLEVNQKLSEHPELVNQEPYTNGWLIQVRINQEAEVNSLLSYLDYKKIID